MSKARPAAPKAAADPARGEVWLVDLDPTLGREQAGRRPVLIVSADPLNRSAAGIVIALPITGTDRGIAAHVPLRPPDGGLSKPSVVMADQVRTLSKFRLLRRLGAVGPAAMRRSTTASGWPSTSESRSAPPSHPADRAVESPVSDEDPQGTRRGPHGEEVGRENRRLFTSATLARRGPPPLVRQPPRRPLRQAVLRRRRAPRQGRLRRRIGARPSRVAIAVMEILYEYQ